MPAKERQSKNASNNGRYMNNSYKRNIFIDTLSFWSINLLNGIRCWSAFHRLRTTTNTIKLYQIIEKCHVFMHISNWTENICHCTDEPGHYINTANSSFALIDPLIKWKCFPNLSSRSIQIAIDLICVWYAVWFLIVLVKLKILVNHSMHTFKWKMLIWWRKEIDSHWNHKIWLRS